MEQARYKAKKSILGRRFKAAKSVASQHPAASFASFASQMALSPASFLIEDFGGVNDHCSHARTAALMEQIDAGISPKALVDSIPADTCKEHMQAIVAMLSISRTLLHFIQRCTVTPPSSASDPATVYDEHFQSVVNALALDPETLSERRWMSNPPADATAGGGGPSSSNLTRVTHSLADPGYADQNKVHGQSISVADDFWDASDQQLRIEVDNRSVAARAKQLAKRVDLRQNQPRITKRAVLLAELNLDPTLSEGLGALETLQAAFRSLLTGVAGLTDVASGPCSCRMYEAGERGDGSIVTYNFALCCTFDDRARAEAYKVHPRYTLAREQLLAPLLRRTPEQSICILDCLDFMESGQCSTSLSSLPGDTFAEVMSELAAAVQRNHDEAAKRMREEAKESQPLLNPQHQVSNNHTSARKLKHQPLSEAELQTKALDALGGPDEVNDFMATHRIPKNKQSLKELETAVACMAGRRRVVGLGVRNKFNDFVGIVEVMQRYRFDIHVQRKGLEALAAKVRALVEAHGEEADFGEAEGGGGDAPTRQIISTIVSSMRDFKKHKGIQRHGSHALNGLLQMSGIVTIVSAGGVAAILDAMDLMRKFDTVIAY